MENKIYNLIILDESGSMSYIKPQAISGLNETLQTIKDAQEKYENQSHYVTLVSFNTNRIKTIYDCCPICRIQELNDNDYQPSACTPLYDAMGISLTQLKEEVKDEDNVLVTIITDGYENASCEYSGKAIAQLVEELKTKGWVFAYIGANQDVEKVASSMGIRNSFLDFRQSEEISHTMENVIYLELRKRGYNVDVGTVEIREGNSKKQLEIDFVANKGNNKIYIQSALEMKTPEKVAQEQKSLLNVNDFFKKIIIVGDNIKKSRYENGIIIMSIYDFLLYSNSLEY